MAQRIRGKGTGIVSLNLAQGRAIMGKIIVNLGPKKGGKKMPPTRRPVRRPKRKPRPKMPAGPNIPGIKFRKGKIGGNEYGFERRPDSFTVDLRPAKKPKVKVIR